MKNVTMHFPFSGAINVWSYLLKGTGVLTTVASVLGSYRLVLLETQDELMAGSFATGLAIAIFTGWHIAFNTQTLTKRLLAALIATSAATLSGYTVYQYNQNEHQQRLEHSAKVKQAEALTIQQQAKQAAQLQQQQVQTEIKTKQSQLNEQHTQLSHRIEPLQQANQTDQALLDKWLRGSTTVETKVAKLRERQIVELRKSISDRNQQIATYTAEQTKLTEQLQALQLPVVNVSELPSIDLSISTTMNMPSVPFSWGMFLRAYMFEGLTFLALLFDAWLTGDRTTTMREMMQQWERYLQEATGIFESSHALFQCVQSEQQAVKDERTNWTTAYQDGYQQLQTLGHYWQQEVKDLTQRLDKQQTFVKREQQSLQQQAEQAQQVLICLQTATTSASQTHQNLTDTVTQAKTTQTHVTRSYAEVAHLLEQLKGELSNPRSNRVQIATQMGCVEAHAASQIHSTENLTKWSRDKLITKLKNQTVPVNERQRLTIRHVMRLSGLGRPTVEDVFKHCVLNGDLVDTGHGLSYPPLPTSDLSFSTSTLPINVHVLTIPAKDTL